jgi:hypothetical protein
MSMQFAPRVLPAQIPFLTHSATGMAVGALTAYDRMLSAKTISIGVKQ